MVRLGILGNDDKAILFVREARRPDQAVLAALCPGNQPRTDLEAAGCSGARVLSGADELAASPDVDAVYVCGSYNISFDEAIGFLESKKHVLIGGISGFSRKELAVLFRAAEKNRVTFLESLPIEANPWVSVLKREMHRLGRISHAAFFSCSPSLRCDCEEADPDSLCDVDFSHGALAKRGAGCIYPMVQCFGMPDRIEAEPVFCENGMDIAGSITGQWGSIRTEILYSSVSGSHIPSRINGERGRFVIKDIGEMPEVCYYNRQGGKEVLLQGRDTGQAALKLKGWSLCMENKDWYGACMRDLLMFHEIIDRIAR